MPPISIDDLVYSYTANTNKLQNVIDNTNNTSGFNNGNKSSADYTYDLNGNLKTDANKGITEIIYNHLNLPTKITFGMNYVRYIYDAIGQKMEKTVSNMNNSSSQTLAVTDYLGGFQYTKVSTKTRFGTTVDPKKSSQFFPTEGGYYNFLKNSYVFNYTDHLGNVRLSYEKDATTGSLKILEESNYYPFGLKHSPSSVLNAQPSYKYKYNGKELQDENIGGSQLNLYDYGARNYDPAIGRWMNIDPLAEIAPDKTPYHFVSNNPISRIDPNGLTDYEINSKGEVVKTIENKKADNFYMLDNDGNRLEDKSITFDYGTIESHRSQSGTYQKRNDDGTTSEEVTMIDIFKVRGDENGTKLFEFFADNTNAEWSQAKTGIEGDKGLNFLTTGHIEYTEPGMSALINGQLAGGYTLREFNHNHPGGTAVPSGIPGLTGKTGDVSFAKSVTEWYGKAYPNRSGSPTYNIYITGKPYIPYSKDSKKEDYGY